MKLLHTKNFTLEEFFEGDAPPYAILSHTWGDNEITYNDIMRNPEVAKQKQGYRKVKYCCDQADKDGLDWIWVDACCIDKSSSAELGEALNSMFYWYRNAKVCYAYLADLSDSSENPENEDSRFRHSRWFTRGWTLQELIAPGHVVFYSNDWSEIGTKESLCKTISEITGVDERVLRGGNLRQVSIARRMSWAALRKTKRIEDMAYSLMGIFNINMPLLYGEGKKAFIRLQEEIMKNSEDHTILAWKAKRGTNKTVTRGPLAESPAEFGGARDLVPLQLLDLNAPYSMTNRGLQIHLPVLSDEIRGKYHAILGCRDEQQVDDIACIELKPSSFDGCKFCRIAPSELNHMPIKNMHLATMKTIFLKEENPIAQRFVFENCFFLRDMPSRLDKVVPSTGWTPQHRVIQPSRIVPISRTALLFTVWEPKTVSLASFVIVLELSHRSTLPSCEIVPYGTSSSQTIEEILNGPPGPKYVLNVREDFSSYAVEVKLTRNVWFLKSNMIAVDVKYISK